MPSGSSMLKILVTLILSLSAVRADCSSNRTCLHIQLSDMYGDGWDGAKLFMETPWDEMFSDAPICGNTPSNPISHTFCTDATGNYPLMLIHENESYVPENYWEDLFTVSVSRCEETLAKYTGGYNTTMILHYDADTDAWSALYWENLWENEKACDACGESRACQRSSPPRVDKPAVKKFNRPNVKKPIDSSDDTNTNTTKVARVKPRYGPATTTVRVTMFDEEGDGWWKTDYSGASWYLADDRRTTLFSTGTLCNSEGSKSGYCNLCLGEGSYSLRFSGAASEFSSWDFCGVRGGRAQELTFHISGGQCVPDSLLSVEADCFATVVSTVKVAGVINLMGLTTEFVESSQYSIMPALLADAVAGWEARNIEVRSTSLTSRTSSSSSAGAGSQSARRLAEFDVDVEFSASFESETDYGVEGRVYSNVVDLVASLKESLASKVASEGFSASLAHSASLAGSVSLEKVQHADLVSLVLESISYEGVQPMQASTLPAFDDSFYWENSSLHISSVFNPRIITILFVSALVGFVAFMGLLLRGMNGYRSVSQLSDSAHGEVLQSQMDDTITATPKTSQAPVRTAMASSL